jgi:CHAD domain-containing protein
MELPVLVLSEPASIDQQCDSISDFLFQDLSDNVGLSKSDRVLATHQIRKRLKNFRSFVKLLRFCKNEIDYSDANSALRVWGREFSELRDVHVRDEILRELLLDPSMEHYKNQLNKLNKMNLKLVAQLEKKMISEQNLFDQFKQKIHQDNTVRDFIKSLKPAADDILSGFIFSYKESFEAFTITSRFPTPDSLHEWRKRMKDVQFQLQLLTNDIPSAQLPDPEIVNTICDNLGRDHDLFMLTEWIVQTISEKHKNPVMNELISEFKSIRTQIQTTTSQMGFKLYEYTPQQAEENLSSYLHV